MKMAHTQLDGAARGAHGAQAASSSAALALRRAASS
jgi:hypothetical protein